MNNEYRDYYKIVKMELLFKCYLIGPISFRIDFFEAKDCVLFLIMQGIKQRFLNDHAIMSYKITLFLINYYHQSFTANVVVRVDM